MSDSYRRMRNTVRFLLGNLAGFDPAADAVPVEQMVAIDRWALRAHRGAAGGDRRGVSQVRVPPDLPEGAQLLRRGSRRLLSRPAQGPPVHHAEEERGAPLGADRAVPHRREHGALARADPVVHREEIWSFLPGKRGESVFLETWHELPEGAERRDRLEHVHRAQGRRGAGAREAARRGHRRRARSMPRSRCSARTSIREKLKALGEELRFLLIVSQAQVKRVSNAAGPPVGAIKVAEIAKEGGVWIRVQASHRAQVRALLASPARSGLATPEHPTICGALRGQRHGPRRIPDSSYERRPRTFRSAPAASAGCGSRCW